MSLSIRRHFIFVFLLASCVLVSTAIRAPHAEAWNSSEVTMARYVNNARASYGVRRLYMNQNLGYTARRHSIEMARAGRIFHTSNLRYTLRYYSWRIAGENVGRGPSLYRVYKAFMNSSSHRANILRGTYRTLGVGIVWKGSVAYITLMFLG